MRSYRNKKPQKNSKKDDLHQDNPTFWQSNKFYAKRWNFLNQRIESGTVLFHTCYEYFAIFAFVDGNEPYFANINWDRGTITGDNNPHMFRLATDEEKQQFLSEFKEKGYEFKNNRIYHNGKLINYPTHYCRCLWVFIGNNTSVIKSKRCSIQDENIKNEGKMIIIKEYTNDTDFIIVITAKDNQYYVSQIDTCETIKPKYLAKFDELDQAEQFAEKENKQYFFE